MRPETGPYADGLIEFTINADGSVWVPDWDAIGWAIRQSEPMDQGFGILTLLFAARGVIREVDAQERDAIALEYGQVWVGDSFDSGDMAGGCECSAP
jgi:hypothetical protein